LVQYGNFASKTVDFTVALTPFPATEVAVILGAVVTTTVLFFYIKKHKSAPIR